jgi:serine/threonine protein kinase
VQEGEFTMAETGNWVGRTLSGGQYKVVARLGEGGMAFVYRAHDRLRGCDVVVKVPRPAILEGQEFARRFAREVRSLAQLAHPHIVKVLDVGEEEGAAYAVMPFLPGGSLRTRQPVDGRGKHQGAPPHGLLTWLPQVAAALDFMHAEGYVHRDVKPDNILFDAAGGAYLSDFGVVKVLADNRAKRGETAITAQGIVFGTAEYMAPEVIMGQPGFATHSSKTLN